MRILFFCLFLSFLGGCFQPNVRYTRQGSAPRITNDKYIVRGDWDYRKYYTVPRQRLTKIIDSYLGVKYRYGGTSRRGMDCSGFVYVVFKQLAHATLPRSTRGLRRIGAPVSLQRARPGDLIFFRGGLFNRINHVGIYIENRRFAHASSKKGVTYSSLDETYYSRHFAGVRRIF
jgi:hypothetical protein